MPPVLRSALKTRKEWGYLLPLPLIAGRDDRGLGARLGAEEGGSLLLDGAPAQAPEHAPAAAEERRSLLLETIAVRFAASIIMHAQSLYCVFLFDGEFHSVASSFAGAALEGVFFLSAIIALLEGITFCWWGGLANLSPDLKAVHNVPNSRLAHSSSICRACLILILVPIAVGTILSDVGFQQKTGGERPDMWVILAHIKNFSSGAKAEFKDSSKGAVHLILGGVTTSGLTFLICVLHQKRRRRLLLRRKRTAETHGSDAAMHGVIALGIIVMIALYLSGAWMPIFHTYVSICGSFFLSPPGSKAMASALYIDPAIITEQSLNSPNVILVMHESLSGELMMTSDAAVKATPFFHSMLQSEKDYFVFEHTRAVSGDTTDALTVMHAGCNPLDHKTSREYALNTTVATEFKKRGYDTVSFSSRGLTLEGTKWFMTQHQLTTNFDRTYDPEVTMDPLVNPPGQDDRLMLKHFQGWLEETRGGGSVEDDAKNGKRPFFAQFYQFNAHYPFFNNENKTLSETRLDGMLETVDQSIEDMFAYLKEAGYLDNTIVIGAGDHGERREPSTYGRLREWSPDILHSPIYMHVPRSLFRSDEQYETLRHNTRQLTSTLDIFPTILHVLNGQMKEHKPVMDEHCARGIDLLETRIPSDRIVWSFPGVSSDISRKKRGNIALHMGTASSLLSRFGWPKDNDLSIVKYAPIIGTRNPKSEEDSKTLDMDEWKSVARNIKGMDPEGIFVKKGGTYISDFYKNLGVDT